MYQWLTRPRYSRIEAVAAALTVVGLLSVALLGCPKPVPAPAPSPSLDTGSDVCGNGSAC